LMMFRDERGSMMANAVELEAGPGAEVLKV
jgi:hypothetical protein